MKFCFAGLLMGAKIRIMVQTQSQLSAVGARLTVAAFARNKIHSPHS